MDRLFFGEPKRRHAAVGLHHVQRAGHLQLANVLEQRIEIFARDRPHVAVQHCRRRPLVLTPLLGDGVGRRHQHTRQELLQHLGAARLVGWIGVAVQEADSDGGYARCLDLIGRHADGAFIERLEDIAFVADALVDLEAQVSRYEWGLLLETQVVHVRAVGAGDLQDVAESAGGDQRRRRAVTFGKRVDHDGRAVDEECHRSRIETRLANRVGNATMKLGRCGGSLGERDHPALLVERHQVGERASDIRGHSYAHHRPRPSTAATAGAGAGAFRRLASAANSRSRSSSHRAKDPRSAITLYF